MAIVSVVVLVVAKTNIEYLAKIMKYAEEVRLDVGLAYNPTNCFGHFTIVSNDKDGGEKKDKEQGFSAAKKNTNSWEIN